MSLLGLCFPKQGQSVYQLSALLALGLSWGTKWLSRKTIECNLWLCLMSHSTILFMLRIPVFSLSTLSSSLLLSIVKFSPPQPSSCLHPSTSMLLSPPILLIRFCLDNLRKRAPLCSSPFHHSLCHPDHRIHLLATSDLWHLRLAGRITIESSSCFVPGSRGSQEGL